MLDVRQVKIPPIQYIETIPEDDDRASVLREGKGTNHTTQNKRTHHERISFLYSGGCRSISHAIDHKGAVVGVRRSIPVDPFRLGGAVDADLKTGSDSKRKRGTLGGSIRCRLISGVGAT